MRRLQMNWAPNVWPWQVEPRQAPAICQGRPSGTLTRRPARIHGRGARCVGLPERVASICIHLLRARDGRRSSHRQATTETRSITLREAQDQKQITAQPVAPSRPRARSDACTPTNMRLILNLQGVRLRQSKLQLHSRLRAARCNPIDTVGLYSLPVRRFRSCEPG